MRIKLREIDDIQSLDGVIHIDRNEPMFFELNRNGLYDREPNGGEYVFEDLSKIKSWISENMLPVRHYKNSMYSYKLKHIIEENLGQYVTNGETIAAMRELGYACRFYFRYSGVSLNCAFNAVFLPGVIRKHGKIPLELFAQREKGFSHSRLLKF